MSYSGRGLPAEFEELFERLSGQYTPSYDRPKLQMHTNWMRELTDPDELADKLKLLRDGKLPILVYGERTGRFYPKVEFDTLVATGMSGTLPLVYLAKELNVDWLAIRKEDEKTHTGTLAEGTLGKKWLFFDDFIDSGKTVAWIRDVIEHGKKESRFESEWVGVFSYHDKDAFMAPDASKIVRSLRIHGKPNRFERPTDNPWV